MFDQINKPRKIKQQHGLSTVEFAIVSVVFLTVLFMVIEFGRILFTWNMLDEITRRGARLAAVCPVDGAANSNTPSIYVRSILAGNPLGIAPAEFVIEYLDRDGNLVANPAANMGDVDFVRARIAGYQYQSIFPINILFNAPAFETTLPSESLGDSPPGTGVTTC